MGKSRKQQIEEYQFDEASSGSDDNDSSDDESEDELLSMRYSNAMEEEPGSRQRRKARTKKTGSDSSDGDDDGDSDSSDSGMDGSADSENEEEHNLSKETPDSEDNSDHEEDSSSDEQDAPLHQRVMKKEGRGSMQRSSRAERKSRALEEATKRLASFKETQRKKKKQAASDDSDGEGKSLSHNANEVVARKKKKKNKHKPTEVSSKRADFFARGARRLNESGLGVDIGAHRYKPMDPRASSLSGHFDEDRFHKNYAFLEEMRNKEIGQVRKRIAAHKATGKKGNRLRKNLQIIDSDGGHTSTLEEDVARLKVLTETRANLERRKIDRAARQSVKRKIREDVESGKTGAYFLKRKEKKRLELEARFEEIRKRGGEKALEKILAKKRQKNKSRDAGAFAK